MLKIFVYESSIAKNQMYDLEKMSDVNLYIKFRDTMNKIKIFSLKNSLKKANNKNLIKLNSTPF